MSDDAKKPDPVDDLKKGLGLLFRAAKTAVDKLPSGKVEEALLSGVKEVGRAIENVTDQIDRQVFGGKGTHGGSGAGAGAANAGDGSATASHGAASAADSAHGDSPRSAPEGAAPDGQDGPTSKPRHADDAAAPAPDAPKGPRVA